jgi:outer membrane receptor protein involved in Fe transport
MNYAYSRRLARQLVGWSGLFAATLPPLVAQQTAPEPAGETVVLSPFTVSTEQDRGYVAANSVSATRINTPIKELPFAINAFTEQFITDIGASDLFDIVQYAPGVTGAGRDFTSGNTRYNIRGFDTSSPQRNGFQGARYVDSVNIQRVEIVKGPAWLLYGTIEPGSVVNYITKRPHGKRAFSFNQQVGTDDITEPGCRRLDPDAGRRQEARALVEGACASRAMHAGGLRHILQSGRRKGHDAQRDERTRSHQANGGSSFPSSLVSTEHVLHSQGRRRHGLNPTSTTPNLTP